MSKKEDNPSQQLESELEAAGLGDIVRAIDEIPSNDINCTTTGITQLDMILHKDKWGLAEGRDIEIHSDESEAGKTSLALQIGSSWQRAGKRVAICDIAGTITTPYIQARGIVTNKDGLAPGMLLPHWVETEADGGGPKSAEEILGALAGTSDKPGLVDIMDLIIVDDVPCLIEASDLEKEADENQKTGGIAKHLTQHMRKTTHKRATVIWINQLREKMGRSMPGMPAKKISMGGGAIPFWSSIRITLNMVEKLEVGPEGKKESYGMRVKAYTKKNKTSPPYKTTLITYLDDEGFSPLYDCFILGQKLGLIVKSGAQFSFKGERLAAGEWNAYKAVRESLEWSADLVSSVREKLKAGV